MSAMKHELLRISVWLNNHADRLDEMAVESGSGGWSTHQVAEQIKMADTARREASALRKLASRWPV